MIQSRRTSRRVLPNTTAVLVTTWVHAAIRVLMTSDSFR